MPESQRYLLLGKNDEDIVFFPKMNIFFQPRFLYKSDLFGTAITHFEIENDVFFLNVVQDQLKYR